MKPPAPYLPAAAPALSETDQEALTDLYVRGTPENTLRAYERDLIYVTAWKSARFTTTLDWPESEATALAFILDHARDLGDAPPEDPARQVAEALITQGLRKSLACPAPKSQHPITRDVLEQLLATCRGSRRDCRDRALLMLGWASGGRRRSEIAGLMQEDVSLKEFDKKGVLWISLLETKTTQKGETPRLVLKGRAAQALVHWIEMGEISDGPLFRPISKADRVLKRCLSPDAIAQIVRHRLKLAGLPEGFASPHGLRSGFLTQAALDGAPIQAAMRLSLHRSMAQAQKYYDDVDIAENPAADLLG
ncbi:tyrosine-type recombinase/integrase [Ruegeria lacuscaerulensis]|uniref:tyrosine-type recombinase/integrase n=1 Tax=Ruegeria lacuscaerulensis TaxID=55218 RepID=UPI00147CF9CA|nr:tyrosine-type recombinase/integrase [Ruegeria lacuscaerulensis]